MKKTRVYELAKEFRKDTKELLDLIHDMNIDAASHASSLSDEDADAIRERLQSEVTHEVVQKRVSKRVIRRRKKAIPTPEGQASPDEAETEDILEDELIPEAAAEAETPLGGAPPVEESPPRQPPAAEEMEQIAAEAAPELEDKVMEPTAEAAPAKAEEPAPEATLDRARVVKPVEEPEPEPQPEPEPRIEPAAEAAPKTEKPAEARAEVKTPAAKAKPPAGEKPKAQPRTKDRPDKGEPRKAPRPAQAGARKGAEAKPGGKPAEDGKVKRPRWSDGSEPARIISKPSRPMTAEELDGGNRFQRGGRTAPGRPAPGRPAPGRPAPGRPGPAPAGDGAPSGPDRRRKEGGGPGGKRKKGKRRNVSKAELYSGRQGRFRASKVKRSKKSSKTQITQPKAIKMRIKVAEAVSVAELAKRMGVKATEVIKQLMGLGMMVTLSQTIDHDTAVLVAGEFGYEVEKSSFVENELIKEATDNPEDLKSRPPVVTIMGHVDHGKSSVLEAISEKDISIVSGEAGGITQHIGAYRVSSDNGDVVFLDTPGHEAFTSMRARGAQVTDVVILVVAADDGVMEQTREAVAHAQAAKVPIIVAVNKMDKPDVEPDKPRRQLTELGLQPEDWGGDTLYVNVSAKTGLGIAELIEAIHLQAELMELNANPDKMAVGRIVEAELDKGRGPLATVLVQGGTLKVGDSFVVGSHYGKVRALLDDKGRPVDEAGPSIPVQVLGLDGVPEAGDEFQVVEDEKTARQISEHRMTKRRETELSQTTRMSLESFMEKAAEGKVKELNIVIKADVHGSVEALKDALERLSTDKVKLSVIQTGVGAITETDIMLAAASDAIIIGFNVRANPKALEAMEAEGVEVRYYDVIYKVIEEIRQAMEGLLDSLFKERGLGMAEVRDTFKVPKIGLVAGCGVTEGVIRRNALARLVRDGRVIFDGKISSLRRFKDDVKEVTSGYECGIGLENYNDVKVGDIIEAYELEEIRPTLDD